MCLNKLDEVHWHCLICEKPFSTKEKADECFKNHSELETLRWVALESLYLKSYAWDLNNRIEDIVERFKLE